MSSAETPGQELQPSPEQIPTTVPPEQTALPAREARPLPQRPVSSLASSRARWRLPLALYLLTWFSTTFVQLSLQPSVLPKPFAERVLRLFPPPHQALGRLLLNGFTYSAAVMAILTAHELGHYLQARRYRIPASLPFFIPLPISPFGTMGAVIVQESGVADRRSMFDIAITGPLAGLVVALPIAVWGVMVAQVLPAPDHGVVAVYGDPLLLKWIVRLVHGPLEEGADILLNPILFAGWVGFFITAVNLVPIGQLDGGHILYCLLRNKARFVAKWLFLAIAGVVAYSIMFGDGSYFSWWLMLVLIWIFGTQHPPTANDEVPLGKGRIVLGWLTLLFVFIGLAPRPFYEIDNRPKPVARPTVSTDRAP